LVALSMKQTRIDVF